ncbi:hypothetical protein [Cupriavidus ulmosensis]
MKTIKKVLFASVLLASLGATSGVVMAAQKFEPFTDGAGSTTGPRDPFTDGGRSATGQADTRALTAGIRKARPIHRWRTFGERSA